MPKHNLPQELPLTKRRRQSIISDQNTNPLDKDGLSECFKSVQATMYVSVPPQYSQAPIDGIKIQNLDPLIMRFYSPSNGVVIGYSNLEILGQDESGEGSKVAKIIGESPFAFTWIKVDLLCWSPAVGDTLDGYVSAQSPGHIALLINDTFNATIKRDDIPSTWSFVHGEKDDENAQPGAWTDSEGNNVESKLRFTVKAFNTSGRTVHVLGSLLTVADVNRVYQQQPKAADAAKSEEQAVASDSEPQYASQSGSDSSSSSDSSSDGESSDGDNDSS